MDGYFPCPVSAAHIRTSLNFEEEEDMPLIVHIAIKVDDLDKATKFYEGRLRLSPKPAQDMHVGMSQDTSQTETSTWP